MNNACKIIVVHPYKQHSYKTVQALQSNGMLDCYITAIYKKKHGVIKMLYQLMPSKIKSKIDRYYSKEIEEDRIVLVCTFLSLMCTVVSSFPFLYRFSEFLTHLFLKRFNKKAAKIINKKQPDAIISYDTLSGDLLEMLTQSGSHVKKYVDMSAPYLHEMRNIYENELSDFEIPLKSIEKKFSTLTYKEKLNWASLELQYADHFLCASNFTANSLRKYGADDEKISICRYDISNVNVKKQKISSLEGGKLKGVYIGNISYTKGVHNIISVLSDLVDCVEKFTFIGAIQDRDIVHSAPNEICEFLGYVPHDKVLEVCSEADFSIFPSLADGYGFAVAECLQCGIPVICSVNAGASDLIDDGVDGFIVEPYDVETIEKHIKEWYENPDLLRNMQNNCVSASKKSRKGYSESLCMAISKH